MRVDLRIPACQSIAKTVEFSRRAEEAGFSGVGFVDSQMYLRDTYVVMAEVLRATSNLRVHPALTCPGPRHPSVIASAAKTVQECDPDRFELWLGRGGSASRGVGIPALRISEMRQAVTQLRDLMEGKPGVFRGISGYAEPGGVAREYFAAGRGPRMYLGGGKPMPIYLLAGGPLSGGLAGELADGVLLATGPDEISIEQMRSWVRAGAEKAGRDPREITEWLQMRCLVRDTKREAVRSWSPNLPPMLDSPKAESWLAANNIDFELTPDWKAKFADIHTALRSLYPEEIHIMDWDAAVEICRDIPYELQEAAGDRMAVLGTPDQVVQRMKELEGIGCENLYLYPCWTFQFPEPELRAFEEVIGPALGSRRYASWQTMGR